MDRLNRALVYLLGIVTLGGFGLALWIWWFGAKDRARPADFLVVLGARVFPDGTPSRVLQGRVLCAADAWRARLAPRVLITGGGSPSEASVARRLAIRAGVPSDAIVLEEQARSTRENALHSVRLLRQAQASTANVVTDRFHLFRARQLFRLEGLEVGTVGADPRPMPRADRVYWLLREALALWFRPRIVFAARPR